MINPLTRKHLKQNYLKIKTLKPVLINQRKLEVSQWEYFQFKRNSEIFNFLLKSTKVVDTVIKNTLEITFGKKNALIQITVITNPVCNSCKQTHRILSEILESNSIEINLTIRFNVNTTIIEENKGLEIANELIEIYKTKGEEDCKTALDEIYSKSSPDDWLKKWKEPIKENHFDILEKEREWCIENNINFTPAVFINGYLFPKEYKFSDLHFFIENII